MITVMFHGKQVRGLPHKSDRKFKNDNGQIVTERCAIGDTVLLRPGRNEIPESILEDYRKHKEIKALLLKGAMGGIEIVAVDGKAVDHEEVLPHLYEGEELPSTAERMRTAMEDMKREAQLAAAGLQAPKGDEILPANMPITTPESEMAAHPDLTPSVLATKLSGESTKS